MIYSFSKTMPRSSKPTTFSAVPIGRSSGFDMLAKNPEILKSELSMLRTTQAYGEYFSKPAGGTVMIVYVSALPLPSNTKSSNPRFPHFLQKYTVAKDRSSQLTHL